MKITFEDLTFEAQMRLLAEAGVESPREMGWHVTPVAIAEFEKKKLRSDEGRFADDRADRDYGGPLY
ncbi:MAG: hypothetical protein ACYSP9_00245 [Planctomycetota bacterium]|jgi:hypothetical protein